MVTSRRGELSVRAVDWSIAAKTLRPLPNEHKPLSDEARIRLRYVDMMLRPEPREMVRTKAAVLRSLGLLAGAPAAAQLRPGAVRGGGDGAQPGAATAGGGADRGVGLPGARDGAEPRRTGPAARLAWR